MLFDITDVTRELEDAGIEPSGDNIETYINMLKLGFQPKYQVLIDLKRINEHTY